jgi:cell division protein FtsL
MNPDILTALIAAFTSLVASLVTLVISVRSLRNEKEKIRIELDKLKLERERFQQEQNTSAKQELLKAAEIEKSKAEVMKLTEEVTEIRYQRALAERNEIKGLLGLFQKAAFSPMDYDEDPTSALNSIRATRIALQTQGAALVGNEQTAETFQKLEDMLLQIEVDVADQYPDVFNLALELYERKMGHEERKELVKSKVKDDELWDAIEYIRLKAVGAREVADQIRKNLIEREAVLLNL